MSKKPFLCKLGLHDLRYEESRLFYTPNKKKPFYKQQWTKYVCARCGRESWELIRSEVIPEHGTLCTDIHEATKSGYVPLAIDTAAFFEPEPRVVTKSELKAA